MNDATTAGVNVILWPQWCGHKNNVAASAETHTNTAPPRPVTKVPLQRGYVGHASATTQTAAPGRPYLLALKSPAPVDSLGHDDGGD